MNKLTLKAGLVTCALVVLLLLTGSLNAFSQEGVKAVSITSMSGEVLILRQDAVDWQPANPGDTITVGDSIKTLAGAKARLQFPLRGTIDINENTQMAINMLEAVEGGKTEMSLLRGKIKTNIEGLLSEKSRFEVKTPTAVAGVVGTEFYLNVSEESGTIIKSSQVQDVDE